MNEILEIDMQTFRIGDNLSTKIFTDTGFLEEFIILNSLFYKNDFTNNEGSSIDLIIQKNIQQDKLILYKQPSFTVLKKLSRSILSDILSVQYDNIYNEYKSGEIHNSNDIVNVLKKILYEEFKECRERELPYKQLTYCIPLNVQDEELHSTGYGRTEEYYITGLRIRNLYIKGLNVDMNEFKIGIQMLCNN